jgi:putative hydrolase of the HAD superfamily
MTVRAVIFDFGGVLCFPPNEIQVALAAQAAGLSVTDFLMAFWGNRIKYDAGQCTPSEYWREVAVSANTHFDDALIPILIQHEIDFWSNFDEHLLRWIRDLRAAGFLTGILSNLPLPLGEALRAKPGFLKLFDHVTFSYELGMVKPEPGIYEHAIAGLHVKPEEALFLDDRPDNVEGARAVGLHAQVYSCGVSIKNRKLFEAYALPARVFEKEVLD